MRRRVLTPWLISLALCACGCANILFERGPYAIRKLEVVYSVQEDVTFLSWRLRKDAKLDRVSFEIWLDEGYEPFELSAAPFPTEPYECGEHWCFQYQVDGEYELPHEGSPLRSVHEDEGAFMGPAERSRRVRETFDIAPIALGQNDAIDPNRVDWFADNSVRLRREYEWQFTTWTGAGCEEPVESEWTHVDVPISVDHAWTDRSTANGGICFSLRPDRRDEASVYVQDYLVPSAETTFETQEYIPPKVKAPTVWGLLLDLEVRNDDRCKQVKDRIINLVERNIAQRGTNRKLGVYTPLDPQTGEALGGCDQAATRDYPLERMLRDAQTARAEVAPTEVRVLWIFVNNIELPPPERVLDQLELFGLAILFGEGGIGADEIPVLPEDGLPIDPEDADLITLGTRAYTWAIGSNVFMEIFPWDQTTPWRPVEDQTLAADIRSFTRRTLPFSTMLHQADTQVEIETPEGLGSRPLHLKVCDATPLPISAIQMDEAVWGPQDTVPWSEFDDTPPYYYVEIPEQLLVPHDDYVRRREQIVVEVCTAFCSGPFRDRGGTDHLNWVATSECQWRE